MAVMPVTSKNGQMEDLTDVPPSYAGQHTHHSFQDTKFAAWPMASTKKFVKAAAARNRLYTIILTVPRAAYSFHEE